VTKLGIYIIDELKKLVSLNVRIVKTKMNCLHDTKRKALKN